jgi:hypothetical protein
MLVVEFLCWLLIKFKIIKAFVYFLKDKPQIGSSHNGKRAAKQSHEAI